jgi:hypothetical protein
VTTVIRLWERLKSAARAAPALLAACTVVMATMPRAMAHDCSGPEDCAALPPNVAVTTGITAVLAGGTAGWVFFRRRPKDIKTPCEGLRNEVAAGEARIKDLEAQVAAAQADVDKAGAGVPDQPPPKADVIV